MAQVFKAMDKEKYLNRIKYSGSLEPSLVLLKKLQIQHLLHVPFENLDIHNKIPIVLSIDKIFDKIVYQNRGGFCYELNGLFYELLTALGFHAKRVSARVYNQNKSYGKEYDHLAIIVRIAEVDYLTDVGFGAFTFEPLALHFGIIQKDTNGNYLIDTFENEYLRVNKIEDGKATPEYIFKNVARDFSEFEEMCHYHQTSPYSHFSSKKLISLATENGRITITGNRLKMKTFEDLKESEIKDELEFHKLVQKHFYN